MPSRDGQLPDAPPAADGAAAGPVALRRPAPQTAPVVFASPHSGRAYPPAFVTASRLDPLTLRRSEDAFLDKLFAAAPDAGAPLLCATFPRAYVDANREAYELDPKMFQGLLPGYVTTRSPRIAAGLGTVPKVVANGEEIYYEKLSFAEACRRIETTHKPYHEALSGLIQETLDGFGSCLVVDCHSMPSSPSGRREDSHAVLPDIVLGNCHGTSCAPAVTALAEDLLRGLGFSVARNRPYAGGYTTRHYGRPRHGVHALQVEINRRLYLDEVAIRPTAAMSTLTERLTAFIEGLSRGARAALLPAAAE